MNSHFFMICFGVLACYAAWRTARRGWVRVLIMFFLVICLIKVGFDAAFPPPVYVAEAHAPQIGSVNVHGFLAGIANDRCILSHLQDTPLGPIAYMMQMHRFLANYQQMQASGTPSVGAISAVVSDTLDTAPRPGQKLSTCDKFDAWMQAQAQAGIQNVAGAANEQ